VVLEEPDLNSRGTPFLNSDGSTRMKNMNINSNIYIEMVLEPFRIWAAENGLWHETNGKKELLNMWFMQDGKY
jgi:hypothetical protein